MMNSAVKSASLRDRESVAWAYSRLAYYELQRGHLAESERMADASLQYVPDYAAALLARGRVELAQKKYTDAVETLERAARLNPLPEYQWTLADALRLLNRNEEAGEMERQLVRDGLASDPRTLALYLSTRGDDGERAVDLARRELGNRRDVFTLDALAWALASTGQVREASTLMTRALLPKGLRMAVSFFTQRRSRQPMAVPPTPGAGSARHTRCDSRCCLPSWGCSGRESFHHPGHEVSDMNKLRCVLRLTAVAGLLAIPLSARASSHMDAPLITLDDAANTTDVYAFVSQKYGRQYLTTALAVYPHEEPGVGPNKYNFDDDVLYEIRVATGNDVAKDGTTYTYQFRFDTSYRNVNTILQSYLGVVGSVGDASQNLIQRYTVDKVDWQTGRSVRLGSGIVPPNNQGNATPKYNRNNDGEQPAKDGVADEGDLDPYTVAVHRRAGERVSCLCRPEG